MLPALLFYLAFYVVPLAQIFDWSLFAPRLTLKFYIQLFGDLAYLKALRNTIDISLLTTVIALLLGYPLAYLMVTSSARTSRILMLLVLIPFWTSILVRSFAWIVILGNNGLVNRLLMASGLVSRPVALLFNMTGVQIGMVHVLLPFMVLPLYSAMRAIDRNVLQAARSLGAPPVRAFAGVFLPLSLPGVGAGCVLVFLLAVGFYITPALLGGPGQITLATMIDMMVNTLLNWGFAATLGVVLLLTVAIIFALFSALMGTSRMMRPGGA